MLGEIHPSLLIISAARPTLREKTFFFFPLSEDGWNDSATWLPSCRALRIHTAPVTEECSVQSPFPMPSTLTK